MESDKKPAGGGTSFGKRDEVRDAGDRHANVDPSYLAQRSSPTIRTRIRQFFSKLTG